MSGPRSRRSAPEIDVPIDVDSAPLEPPPPATSRRARLSSPELGSASDSDRARAQRGSGASASERAPRRPTASVPPSAPASAPPASTAASAPPRPGSPFVLLWTLAIIATVCAFVVHLALRGRTMALGYELGRARAEQARLREVQRVLDVEVASYKTPERVEIVATTLLGMEPPPPERVVPLGEAP